jgi:deoxyribonuclease-4
VPRYLPRIRGRARARRSRWAASHARLLVRTVGRGRLRLVHVNDSKDPCGSGRDRHEIVGRGHIGAEAFVELFRHPATRGVPMLLETPGTAAEHRAELAALKAMRGR